MKSETNSPNERFLSRWSRLKREQAAAVGPAPQANPATQANPAARATPANPTTPATTGTGGIAAAGTLSATSAAAPSNGPADHAGVGGPVAMPLPAIDSLTMDSDFAPFFQAKVPDALRRAAVKKLFADPHFNIMDGLDTYIDDYTKADPLPAGWLEQLSHARDIIDHPSDRKAAEEAVVAADEVRSALPEAHPTRGPGDSRDSSDGVAITDPATDALSDASRQTPAQPIDPHPAAATAAAVPIETATPIASPHRVAGPPASDIRNT